MTTIAKQQFKNNTGGHLGVVLLDSRGVERGASVEPDGFIWLSEAEQILTANAPRQPQDNPFIEHAVERINPESGEVETVTYTPLTPSSDERWVPASERHVPGVAGSAQANLAATGPEPVMPLDPTLADNPIVRERQIVAAGPDAAPNQVPPPRALAAAEAAKQASARLQSEDTPEEPPSEPQEPPSAPEPTPEPPPTPEAPEEAPVQPEDETAVKVDPAVGEETAGAPEQPVEGEYGKAEEVGTPDVQPTPRQQAPAPWTPGSEG